MGVSTVLRKQDLSRFDSDPDAVLYEVISMRMGVRERAGFSKMMATSSAKADGSMPMWFSSRDRSGSIQRRKRNTGKRKLILVVFLAEASF